MEIVHEVGGVIYKENHTLIYCILHKENKLIFVQKSVCGEKMEFFLKPNSSDIFSCVEICRMDPCYSKYHHCLDVLLAVV